MTRNPIDKLIRDDAVPRVAMQVAQGVLVVPVQIELYEATLKALREDMLGNIRRTGVHQALIDLSAVEVMDSYAYVSICDTAAMASVMGAKTVLAGIKAGVASVLVEFDVDVKRVAMALNLEAGLAMLADWEGHATPPEAELRDDLANSMVEDDARDGAAGGRVDTGTVPLQDAGTSPVAGPPDRS